MVFRLPVSLLALVLITSACGPGTGEPIDDGTQASGSSESTSMSESESESESETDTGEMEGPQNDPEQALECWEQLGDVNANDVWGLSTEQLLFTTFQGVVRVEGDTLTTLGDGSYSRIWASDLDNGWAFHESGLMRLIDGALEPWPEPLELTVYAIEGLGPDDVWASGPTGVGGEFGLAHFDGASWTEIDKLQAFGPDAAATHEVRHIVATSTGFYMGGSSEYSGLLWWNGSGAVTEPIPYYDFVTRLSTRDGERPLVFIRWCDFGCAVDSYEFDADTWSSGLLPHFDDWDGEAVDLQGEPGGVAWALVGSSFGSQDSHLRVARHRDGVWQRARTPGAEYLHAMPDGVVLSGIPRRATSVCLFGD